MAPDRVQLPQETVARVGALGLEQAIDQARYQVCTERQPGGYLAFPLVLSPCPLQERRVRQNVRRRLSLTEELLRREQGRSFR